MKPNPANKQTSLLDARIKYLLYMCDGRLLWKSFTV